MSVIDRLHLPRRLSSRLWLLTLPSALVSFEDGFRGSGAVLLGVRPEDIRLAADLSPERAAPPFRAHVELVELLGAHAIISLRTAGGTALKAIVDRGTLAHVDEGEEAEFAFERAGVHLFARDGGERLSRS